MPRRRIPAYQLQRMLNEYAPLLRAGFPAPLAWLVFALSVAGVGLLVLNLWRMPV